MILGSRAAWSAIAITRAGVVVKAAGTAPPLRNDRGPAGAGHEQQQRRAGTRAVAVPAYSRLAPSVRERNPSHLTVRGSPVPRRGGDPPSFSARLDCPCGLHCATYRE